MAFYKGTLTPLIGIGACVSVQFGAFHEARRRLETWNKKYNPGRSELTYAQYYLAGATAGVANSKFPLGRRGDGIGRGLMKVWNGSGALEPDRACAHPAANAATRGSGAVQRAIGLHPQADLTRRGG